MIVTSGETTVEVSHLEIMVTCPKCRKGEDLESVLTAQSNQNVIYECPYCHFSKKNITTSKG